jgi:phage-related protein (TIGR01555 family)
MAMDDAGLSPGAGLGTWATAGIWGEGLFFPGYPYLAELTQRPEYRHIIETIAGQMTRRWIKLNAVGDTDKSDKINALEAAMKRFGLRDVFFRAFLHDGQFGMGVIFPSVCDPDDREELKLPLLVKKGKIGKGDLREFVNVEPTWMSPVNYNSTDPLRSDFFVPNVWYVMGKAVHATRLMIFVSRPVPDILKPAYNFGGLSMSQMVKPYVDNWLRTRQSVSDLLHSFSVFVLKTRMMAYLSDATQMAARLSAFILGRDNKGLMMIDKEAEELENVSVPLGTLDHLQAQAQEQMASVAQTPLVWLLGVTPTGLNATPDGEIRVFYDRVRDWQERSGAQVTTALEILQLNEFGEIDPDIGYEFLPLWQLDDAGRAAVQKTQADTDSVLIADGVIAPEEARNRLAADAEGPYHGLEGPPPDPPEDLDPDTDKDDAASITKAGAEGSKSGANASDAAFNEADHPRGQPENSGQFGPEGSSTKELPRKGKIDLPSGGEIDVSKIRMAVGKAISEKKIRSELQSKAGLSEKDAEHVAVMIEADPAVKQRRAAAAAQNDPAAIERNRKELEENYQIQERHRKASAEKHQAQIADLLASPGAGLWNAENRKKVETEVAIHDPEGAIYEAKFATLAAVEKIATTELGLKLRHVSASRGRPDSRYFTHTDADGTKTEIRVSNHEIPETEARFNRNVQHGSRWAEIIVGPEQIKWSAAEWKAALRGVINQADVHS